MSRPAHPLTLLTLLAAGVGVIDATRGDQWDLVVLFGAVIALQLVVLLGFVGTRVAVSLRPDLARWAEQRSQRTGEPVGDVLDRSVAWFQHGLYGEPPTDGD